MFVEPLPGVDLNQLRQALWEVETRIGNVRATTGTAVDVYNAYISWVHETVRHLSPIVAGDGLDRLVLTQRYWTLQAQPTTAELQPMRQLLNAEIDERARIFREAVESVDAEKQRWLHPGALVMPDTSFYVTHDDKIEDADLAAVVQLREEPIRVVVPILVIDELDNLKRHTDKHVRWRAAYTLAVFDRVLRTSAPSVLRDENFDAVRNQAGGIPRGRITVEVMFDPPGHERLPIADDEIVSRALMAEARSGRRVRVVTYDTGQSTRARHAGLDVFKLSVDPGPEPGTRGT